MSISARAVALEGVTVPRAALLLATCGFVGVVAIDDSPRRFELPPHPDWIRVHRTRTSTDVPATVTAYASAPRGAAPATAEIAPVRLLRIPPAVDLSHLRC